MRGSKPLFFVSFWRTSLRLSPSRPPPGEAGIKAAAHAKTPLLVTHFAHDFIGTREKKEFSRRVQRCAPPFFHSLAYELVATG